MTKQEAIEILRDTPIDIRSTREDDIHTLYATAQLIAIECIEQWSRVCNWVDEPDMKIIAEYVHRYGIEYIIECVEKQTPMEAECHVSGNGWNDWLEFTCPVCGKKFKERTVCPRCYQRVMPRKESDNDD